MLNRVLLEKTITNFGLSLDDAAFSRLDTFAVMLAETNKSFNLTAITEPDEMTVKHFADCLSVFAFVDIPESSSIIDVGTGAGFPGMVLLLARPDIKMTFLDSLNKRLNFIEDVLKATGVDAETLHARAEDAGRDAVYRESFDFATARAVADLSVLSEYCLPFVKVGGSFVSMKSADTDGELDNAKAAINILGGEIKSVNSFDLVENMPRKIVEIKKISQTPTAYPRTSKKIAKSPIK
ncbi:MAG: 16S rRNA (guanine(527)-N(7))-methyltransferase RsmG [Clostridiaceae bacterium]|nr:16S rRNA (guanine(527)-N(7))-methyltransferase RsmG [Clostridiaceae bacterium]